jgi:hypothetical protein
MGGEARRPKARFISVLVDYIKLSAPNHDGQSKEQTGETTRSQEDLLTIDRVVAVFGVVSITASRRTAPIGSEVID